MAIRLQIVDQDGTIQEVVVADGQSVSLEADQQVVLDGDTAAGVDIVVVDGRVVLQSADGTSISLDGVQEAASLTEPGEDGGRVTIGSRQSFPDTVVGRLTVVEDVSLEAAAEELEEIETAAGGNQQGQQGGPPQGGGQGGGQGGNGGSGSEGETETFGSQGQGGGPPPGAGRPPTGAPGASGSAPGNERASERASDNAAVPNTPPTANPDFFSVGEDSSISFLLQSLAQNDSDADGEAITVTLLNVSALTGSVSVSGGTVTYTPDAARQSLGAGQSFTERASYTLSDGEDTVTSTVTFTVQGVNDAPIVVDEAAATTQNDSVRTAVLSNDSDIDNGDVLSAVAVSVPAEMGAVRIEGDDVVFTPQRDFLYLAEGETADVPVTYSVSDGQGGIVDGTLTVTVQGTNDGPVVVDGPQSGAVQDSGDGVSAETLPHSVDGTIAFADVDLSDTHTATVEAAGDNATDFGSLSVSVDQAGNAVAWTFAVPDSEIEHLDAGDVHVQTYTVTIEDGHGATASQTVAITITGSNDAPVAAADTGAGHENETLTIDVLANDTDVDGDDAPANLTLDSVTIVDAQGAPMAGGWGSVAIVNNQLVFTPGSDFDDLDVEDSETVRVSYTMSDDSGAASASLVTIKVQGTNDAPVAVVDTATAHENQTLTVDVLANDTDVDGDDGPVNFTLLSASSPVGQGVATVVGNQLVFTPGSDFDDLDEGDTRTVIVSYTSADDSGAESVSTVTITVTGTNDAPVAIADVAESRENETLTIDILANDTDLDGDDGPANFTLVSATAPDGQGVASIVDNQLAFTPGTDFDYLASGETVTVAITYALQDDSGAESASTVAVTVTGTNDGPVVAADLLSATEDAVLTGNVLADNGNGADSDVDVSDTLSVTAGTFATAEGGTVTLQSDGSYSYTPAPDFNGEDSFTYSLSDGIAATTGTATVTVAAINDAPTIVVPEAGGVWGSETIVNTTTDSYQIHPDVAFLPDGGRVVVWASEGQDAAYYGIYAQRYDASGAKVGGEVQVHTNEDGLEFLPSVTVSNAGRVTVVWQGKDDSTTGIRAQNFDAELNPVGPEYLVNDRTYASQSEPDVISLANGKSVVFWFGPYAEDPDGGTPTGNGVFARILDAGGTPSGRDILVNSEIRGHQFVEGSAGTVASAFDDGGFVVTWTSRNQDNPGDDTVVYGYGVYAQRFDGNGDKVGGEIRVNDTVVGDQLNGSVATLPDGSFVVAWQSADESLDGIVYRIFEADGTPRTGELQANSYESSRQFFPEVVSTGDGSFSIVWVSYGQDGSGDTIVARDFGADGRPIGAEMVVNETVTGSNQTEPAIAVDPNGGYTVAWRSYLADGSLDGIVMRDYAGPGPFVAEDGTTALNGIEIGDVDSGTAPVTLTLSAGNGVLDVAAVDGVAVAGSGTDTIVLTGSVEDINAAIAADGVIYRGNANFNGTDTVSVHIDDGGNSGAGAALTADATFDITVYSVNDAPTIETARIREDVAELSDPPATILSAEPNWTITSVETATLSDGGSVVVWAENRGNRHSVFAQRYDVDGAATGPEIAVGQLVSWEHNAAPSVAALSDGRFVVTHTVTDTNEHGVSGTVFAADGTVASVFNAPASETGDQFESQVHALSGDRFAVVMNRDVGSAYQTDVQMRLFGVDAQGMVQAEGVETNVVSTAAVQSGYQFVENEHVQSITELENGNIVVAYTNILSGTDGVDIFVRVIHPDGTIVAGPRANGLVAAGTQTHATVTALKGGGFVVSWSDQSGNDGEGWGVFQQLFNANAQYVYTSDSGPVSTDNSGSQAFSQLVALDDGGWIVLYQSQNLNYDSGTGIAGQRYGADGQKVGGEFSVSAPDGGWNQFPSVTLRDDGSLQVTWIQDGSKIVQRVVDATGVANGDTDSLVGTGYGPQLGHEVAALANGGFVTVSVDASRRVFVRRFDAEGEAAGEMTMVNTAPGHDPTALGLPDGSFVVVWRQSGSIVGQRFDADGTKVGAITPMIGGGATYAPDLAALSDGQFVMTWTESAGGETTRKGAIFETDESDGIDTIAAAFDLSTTDAPANYAAARYTNSVEALANGGFVASWEATVDGRTTVFTRGFDADGSPHGDGDVAIAKIDAASYATASSLTGLTGGGYVVSWIESETSSPTAGDSIVYQQRFGADGTPVGDPQALNYTTFDAAIMFPHPVGLPDGGWVTLWSEYIDAPSNRDILGRRFDAEGVEVGETFRVNAESAGAQGYPSATLLADGSLAVLWRDGSTLEVRTVDPSFAPPTLDAQEDVPIDLPDIVLGDPDTAPDADVQVTVSVQNGGLAIASADGLTSYDNADPSAIVLTGTVAAMNAALDTLRYRGAPDFNGTDTVTLTVDDLATGEPLTATESFAVTVSAVADAPVVTDEDVAVDLPVFALSDFDAPADATLSVTVTAQNGAVSVGAPDSLDGFDDSDPSALVLSGSRAALNAALESVSYRGDPNFNGSDSVTLTVRDSATGQTVTGSKTFEISVTAVNDAPVARDDTFALDEDGTASGNILADNGGGADTDVEGPLTVTAGTFQTAQGGSFVLQADGSFTYTPPADFNGTDSVDYTISDGAESDIGTATFTVAAVGDAPLTTVTPPIWDTTTDVIGEQANVTAEVPVDTTDTAKRYLEIAAQPDGGHVVVWEEHVGGKWTVQAQSFDSEGAAIGTATALSPAGVYAHYPTVTGLGAGRYAVGWTETLGAASRTYIQVFESDGTAAGNKIDVNERGPSHQYFHQPQIELLAGGEIAALFSYGDYSYHTILEQSDGDLSLLTRVRISNSDYWNDENYAPIGHPLAALPNGNFVRVASIETDYGNGELNVREYAPNGTEISGNLFRETWPAPVAPSVTALANGGFVVTWTAYDNESHPPSNGVFFEIYADAATIVHPATLANTIQDGAQQYSEVQPLADGGFVILYQSAHGASGGGDILGQRFDAAGDAVGGEFRINANGAGAQDLVSFDTLADGTLIAAWRSGTDIVQKSFAFGPPPIFAGGEWTAEEDSSLVITGISVTDGDTPYGTDALEVTLSVDHGTLTLAGTDGLVSFTGNGTNAVTLSGPQAAVNAAVEALTYLPDKDYFGDDTLTVGVDDLNNGGDGRFTTHTLVPLNVTPAPDVPVLTAALGAGPYAEDQPVALDISVAEGAAGDGSTLTVEISGLPDGASLSAGTESGGVWTLTPAQLVGLTLTPPSDFNGEISLPVTGVASLNGKTVKSVTETLTPTLAPVNDEPMVDTGIADQSTAEEAAFSFAVPTDAFEDVDAQALTLTATLANGDPLPNWLSFDGTTFTGTPDDPDLGTVAVMVTASDGVAGSSAATTVFDLTVTPVNDDPAVDEGIADQTTPEGASFSFAIPPDAFTDVDGDGLTFTATLSNGDPLPDWLSFDGTTFSGDPDDPQIGALDVRVTASDGVSGSAAATEDFTLTVLAAPDVPVITANVPSGIAMTDEQVVSVQNIPTFSNDYSRYFNGSNNPGESGLKTTAPLVASTGFTLEAWVYANSFSGSYNTIFEFGNDSPWIGALGSGSESQLSIFPGDVSGGAIPVGQWTHVAMTYEPSGQQVKLFVNGEQTASGTHSIQNDPSKLLSIGHGVGDAGFKGRIDEVRYWDSARDESEIQATMHTPMTGAEGGLRHLWNMEETVLVGVGNATGNSTFDASLDPNVEIANNNLAGNYNNTPAAYFDGTSASGMDVPITTSQLSSMGTDRGWTIELKFEYTGDPQSNYPPNGFVTLFEFGNDSPWVGLWNGRPGIWGGGANDFTNYPFSSDTTQHVAVQYDGYETVSLFVNGGLHVSKHVGTSSVWSNGTSALSIGHGQGDIPFNGYMDEIRLWSDARTSTEIQASMNTPLGWGHGDLVALYNFEETQHGPQDLAGDSPARETDGTSLGSAGWPDEIPTVPVESGGTQSAPYTLLLDDGRILLLNRTTDPEITSTTAVGLRVGTVNGDTVDWTNEVAANSNSSSSVHHTVPQAVQLADGRILVYWTTNETGDSNIYGRVGTVRADGSIGWESSEFGIDTASGYQRDPQATVLSDGRVMFVWQDFDDGYEVSGRIGTISGSGFVGASSEFSVPVGTDNYQYYPAVTELPDGRVMVAFASLSSTVGDFDSDPNIYIRTGTPTSYGQVNWDGTEVLMDQAPDGENLVAAPELMMLADGRILLNYYQGVPDGVANQVTNQARLGTIEDDGSVTWTDAFRLGTTNLGGIIDIVQRPDGTLFATWRADDGADGDLGGIEGAVGRLTEDGISWGTPTILNQETQGYQTYAQSLLLPDGRIFAAWQSADPQVTTTGTSGISGRLISIENTSEVLEGGSFPLSLTIAEGAENDGSALSIELTDMPVGTTLSAGTYDADSNTWTLTQAQLDGLTVTPPENFFGDFTATATGVASLNGFEARSTSEEVTVAVIGVDDPITVDQGIADQQTQEETAFVFAVPADAFSEVDGQTVTYTATLADGSDLPTWLSFDPDTQTFNGTPDDLDVGTVTVQVSADDGALSVSDTFDLTVTNVDDPMVVTANSADALEDVVYVFQASEFTSVFSDADAGDELTAIRIESLPASGTLRYDGTPAAVGQTVNVEDIGLLTYVSAQDESGTASFDWSATQGRSFTDPVPMTIEVQSVNDAPKLESPLADQTVFEDRPFSFTVPLDAFTDVEGDTVTLSASMPHPFGGWIPLPTAGGSVNFDPATGVFSGLWRNPGDLSVRVTASDGSASRSADFTITVANTNDAPEFSIFPNSSLSSITEDDLDTSGTLVSRLTRDVSDDDWGAVAGVAVTGSTGNGGWEFKDGSEDWAAFGSVSSAESLLLGADTLIRYVPDGANGETATITYRAWDQTSGTVGEKVDDISLGLTGGETAFSVNQGTATIIVTDVNDAPIAVDDSFTVFASGTDGNGDTDIDVLANDIDVDSNVLGIRYEQVIASDTSTGVEVYRAIIDDVPGGDERDGLGVSLGDTFDYLSEGETETFELSYATVDSTLESDPATVTITVVGENDTPTLAAATVTATEDETYTFSASDFTAAFSDVDTGDSMSAIRIDTLPAAGTLLLGGAAVSAGETIDLADIGSLSYQPVADDDGSTSFSWSASDGSVFSSSETMTIDIAAVNDAPTIVSLTGGPSLSGVIGFDDVDLGDVHGYSVTFVSGRDVPNALQVELDQQAGTLSWSYSPPEGAFADLGDRDYVIQNYEIAIMDAAGGTVVQPISFDIVGTNDAPVLRAELGDQSAYQGAGFSFTVPEDTFTDIDTGTTLAYSATLADGSDLPAWLGFDGATRTFSGTPDAADVGTLSVRVTASDGAETVSDVFDIAVRGPREVKVVTNRTDEDLSVSAQDIFGAEAASLSHGDVGNKISATITMGGIQGGGQEIGEAYTEDGFVLRAENAPGARNYTHIGFDGNRPHTMDFFNVHDGPEAPGDTELNVQFGSEQVIEREDGGVFDLNAMQIAENGGGMMEPIVFTGTKADGSTVTHTVSIAPNGRETVTFPETFEDVISVRFAQNRGGGWFSFDDVSVSYREGGSVVAAEAVSAFVLDGAEKQVAAMTFDALHEAMNTNHSAGWHRLGTNIYSENGFTLSVPNIHPNTALYTPNETHYNYTGSPGLHVANSAPKIVLQETAGRLFDMKSITLSDALTYNDPGYPPSVVRLLGFRADGTTAEHQVTIGYRDRNAVDLPEDFSDLARVEIIRVQFGRYFQIDNVVFESDPTSDPLLDRHVIDFEWTEGGAPTGFNDGVANRHHHEIVSGDFRVSSTGGGIYTNTTEVHHGLRTHQRGWEGTSAWAGGAQTMIIAHATGAAFNFDGIDIREHMAEYTKSPFSLTIVGTKADGTTVQQAVTVDGDGREFGAQSTQTFIFGDTFENVVEVRMMQGTSPSNYYNVDNIQLSVPKTYDPVQVTADTGEKADVTVDTVIGTRLEGTDLDDILIADDGDNLMLGGLGDDVLIGGLGANTMTGGAGADTFKLAGGQTDTITDFNKGNSGSFDAAEGDVLDMTDLFADAPAVSELGQIGDIQTFAGGVFAFEEDGAGNVKVLVDTANAHKGDTTSYEHVATLEGLSLNEVNQSLIRTDDDPVV